MNQTHVIERAFQLAQESRACLKVADIYQALAGEGYTISDLIHLEGWSIREQLRARIRAKIKVDLRSTSTKQKLESSV